MQQNDSVNQIASITKITPLSKEHEAQSTTEQEKTKALKEANRENCNNITRCIITRFIFLSMSIMIIVFSVLIKKDNYIAFTSILLVIIIADGIYIAVKRKGYEYDWFIVSIMAFSVVFIIMVWILVFTKLDLGDPSCLNRTLTFLMSPRYGLKVRFLL